MLSNSVANFINCIQVFYALLDLDLVLQGCTVQRYMSEKIISPSDGDTSEEEEFTKIMSTHNATVVENVDKNSNSSNSDYTKLVSVSLTTASTKSKYMCIFLHYLNFTKCRYNLLIHHNANLITFNYIL